MTDFAQWLEERRVEKLELIVPDMAGVPRGKHIPVKQFADGHLRLPFAIFAQIKRTLQRVAKAHGLRATFLAKPDADQPDSSLHIHQSVYDARDKNVFSESDAEPSPLFRFYIGGLQRRLRDMLLLFAPYPNSYRRFLSLWSSPVNLEWGVDNRSVGFRSPESDAHARRVEN